MSRSIATDLSKIFIVALLLSTPAANLHAQSACQPACGASENCVLVGGDFICEPKAGSDGTVSEIVITAKKSTAPSFKTFVNDTIVPLFDQAIIPLLYTLAFIFFLIGIVRYFFIEGEEARSKGKVFIVWGLVGLVVIFSVWGIVHLLLQSLGIGS